MARHRVERGLIPDLNLDRLKGHRLFVGTPMYSGQCCSEYALGIAQLAALCTQLGIQLRFYFACNEALVTKARNITADEFLRSGDETLLFIDADIGFDPRDAVQLLALQVLGDAAADLDVIAAPYPLKTLAWTNVREAAKRGLADGDPATLAGYASGVALSPAQAGGFPIDRPVEVTQAGTGFMLIRRATFDRYRAAYPLRRYRPEAKGMEAAASDQIHAFFDTEIDAKRNNLAAELRAYLSRAPQATPAELLAFVDSEETAARDYSGNHVSEDYAFCHRVRGAGMKVWLCPWVELTHTGSHTFASRLVDLAGIDAA